MPRLLFAALRYRIGAMLALGALAVLTIAAAVAVPFYTSAAEDYAVRIVFDNAAPADRSISVTADVPAPLSTDVAMDKLLIEVTRHAPQPEFEAITGALVRGTADSLEAPLVVRPGFCEALTITGRCPQRGGEVVISDLAKQRLGDTFEYLIPRLEKPVTLRVVGTYVPPRDADLQKFWAGRAELTPRPLRAGNPIFTGAQTFDDAKVDSLTATVDLVLAGPALPQGTFDLKAPAAEARWVVSDGLVRLLDAVSAAKERLRISAPLGGLTMLAVSGWILLLAAANVAGGRRAEAAVGDLRGIPRRHRFLLTRGPSLLALILAAPLGAGLGWAFVNGMARWVFGAPDWLDLDQVALIAAGAGLLAAIVGVSIVESRRREGPLLEAFRWVPPPLRRSGLVAELSIVALAVAAAAQSLASGGTGLVAQAAPLLVAAAIGLLAFRLVRPVAKTLGIARIRSGHLASGLAALHLARRPVAAQAVMLVVVCLALTAHAFGAWERTDATAVQRAEAELGAPSVVTVAAPSRPALLAAVGAADPKGEWALAAARERLPRGRALVALDTTRLSILDQSDLAGMLRPASNESLAVNGSEIALDVTVTEALSELPITVALVGPKGTPVTGVATVAPQVGRREYRIAVPECAVAPGCRLAWLSFFRSPDELRLHGLRQLNPDRELAAGAGMVAPARWRPSFEMEPEVRITGAEGSLRVRYQPADPRMVSRDIRVQVADAPVPLPVAVVGEPAIVHNGQLAGAGIFAFVDRPVTVVRSSPSLPGLPEGGVLADLAYADRLSDTFDNDAQLQVWLGERAPADAVARLEAAGLIPMRTDSVSRRAALYNLGGDALGLRLQLAAAVLAVLLAVFAILVLAGTDRRRRAQELADLLDQGVDARVIRRVERSGFVVVLAALPAAVLACLVVWWLGGARPAVVPLGVALLVLIGAAVAREVAS